MYHEKQNLAHCAVHTLNNLFQLKWMTYKRLEEIARSLYRSDQECGLISSTIFSLNPYISTIPYIGYFDIACIVKALEEKACEFTDHIITPSDLIKLQIINPSNSFNSDSNNSDENKNEKKENLLDSSLSNKPSSNFIGLIINEMNSSLLGLWNSRHWFCIIYDNRNQLFVNLDSNLDSPNILGNEKDLKYFLENIIRTKKAQIFIVSKKS